MKLVIEITEEVYTFIRNVWKDVESDKRSPFSELCKAVENGKKLPKGYGRLGDLDALQKEVSSWGMNDYEPSDFIDEINNADTIIEADKGDA